MTTLAGVGLLAVLLVAEPMSGADKDKDAKKAAPTKQPVLAAKKTLPPVPRSALLSVESWQKASMTPLKPGEIDDLVVKELQKDKITPAPLTTDEQFIRRVTLDLTGELPVPADVSEFIASSDAKKRSKLIDKLLETEDYARHWSHYWREVFTAQLTDRRALLLVRPFEDWLQQQFKKNTSWGEITKQLITAEGALRYDEPGKNAPAFLLSSHRGADAANERAAQISRVFLGIQIQCAQCHDHPFDQWKRVQFHELAGYFARLRERPIRDGQRIVGIELISARFGEHEMPSKEDAKKGTATPPRFLNGNAAGNDLSDLQRRQALAKEITDKNNYWFAGAYVNRIWGVLMGQSFYEPVDDMGPQKQAVFPTVLTRLTGAYRGSNYDMKSMFREIMNSQTYQRQIRLNESEEHLHFAAAYPTRLNADALWHSLLNVLGDDLGGGGRPGGRPFPGGGPMGMFRGGLEGLFKQEFAFDPSLKPDEVEGSIPQALLLMNNPTINQRISARGTNLLARILSAYANDEEALRMVYLRTLARKPTDRELDKCKKFITETGNRTEAFEDILWALINSTEFQTKR